MCHSKHLENYQSETKQKRGSFRKLAAEKGSTDGAKAKEITNWLREGFDLGHDHAMAIYTLLKRTKSEDNR